MRHALLTLTVLCLSAGVASADYVNPPDWQSNPYFTHQSFHFNDNANPAVPDEWIAPDCAGTTPPSMAISGAEWIDNLGVVYDPETQLPVGTRQGGWKFMQGDSMVVPIPNCEDQGLFKELWLQGTVKTNIDYLPGTGTFPELWDAFGPKVFANGNTGSPFTFQLDSLELEMLGVNPFDPQTPVWYRASAKYVFDPQPAMEEIRWAPVLEPGYYIILDQGDADTQCIPEPATVLSLAGFGLMLTLAGTFRRLRNRR